MKYQLIFISLIIATVACDTCNDCGPIENDPFVNLGFNYKTSRSAAEVTIDSINGIVAESISEELYSDTLRVFKLPLNFKADSSYFDIVYSSYPDEDSDNPGGTFRDQIAFKYDLELINQNDFIKYQADGLHIVLSTFDSIATLNINQEKLSNAVTLQVYF
jgi:hypothetical protein